MQILVEKQASKMYKTDYILRRTFLK